MSGDPVADAAERLRLEPLLAAARGRRPDHGPVRDVLPPDDLDLAAARSRSVPRPAGPATASRRDFGDQLLRLQHALAGAPELMLWHALAVSYLRRTTPLEGRAARLFHRCWDAEGAFLAERLSARWLVSALQTFADHGRNEPERACGAAGFLYGNLVKVYETEIASAHAPRREVRWRDAPVEGLYGFRPGQDVLLNINSFVAATADDAGSAGLALLALLARVRDGHTIFARTDARVRAGEGAQAHLSWGERPPDRGAAPRRPGPAG